MKVKELIELLQGYNGEMEVRRRVPAHDHIGSELAGNVGSVDRVSTTFSEYHGEDKIVQSDMYEQDELTEVLLIDS